MVLSAYAGYRPASPAPGRCTMITGELADSAVIATPRGRLPAAWSKPPVPPIYPTLASPWSRFAVHVHADCDNLVSRRLRPGMAGSDDPHPTPTLAGRRERKLGLLIQGGRTVRRHVMS